MSPTLQFSLHSSRRLVTVVLISALCINCGNGNEVLGLEWVGMLNGNDSIRVGRE